MILQPVTIKKPGKQDVYSASKLRPQKEISCNEFLAKYADNARVINYNNSFITAYGYGLDCWYIII